MAMTLLVRGATFGARQIMKLRYFVLAVAASAQLASAQTTVRDSTSVQVTPGAAAYTSKSHTEGTVTAIDYTSRSVSLRLDDGRDVTMIASPEIKRLDAIKTGDRVVADYEEHMQAKLIKGGRQPIGWQSTSSDQRAPEGAPTGSLTTTAVLVANIIKVNRKTSTVTFQGALESKDLVVQDPKQLALMKVGDQLEVTITGRLALSVEPVAAKVK